MNNTDYNARLYEKMKAEQDRYRDWLLYQGPAEILNHTYTFFEEYDFSGKTVIPFVTHGGSGFSGTIRTIQSLEPNATVIESGLSVSRNSVPDAAAAVKSWTDSLLTD